MRIVGLSGRVIIALAVALSMPLTSATAATRPAAAVPSDTFGNTTPEARNSKKASRWPLYALAIAAVGVLVVVLASGNNDNDDDTPISRG